MLTMLSRHHRLATGDGEVTARGDTNWAGCPPVSQSFVAPEARAFQGPLELPAKRRLENDLLRWRGRPIATRRFVREMNHRGPAEPGDAHPGGGAVNRR
jgi:hypothetical protein